MSKLTLPDAVNAVGACPDAMPRAHSQAVAAALGQVHARMMDTLRPADFATLASGPHVATLESGGLRLPCLRWGAPDVQAAYAVLGSSAFIASDDTLDAHVGLVWVGHQHTQPVHFDVWLAAPGNGNAVESQREVATRVTGKDAAGAWHAGHVTVSAPPMSAHSPVILTMLRHQPDPVDLVAVTVHMQPRNE